MKFWSNLDALLAPVRPVMLVPYKNILHLDLTDKDSNSQPPLMGIKPVHRYFHHVYKNKDTLILERDFRHTITVFFLFNGTGLPRYDCRLPVSTWLHTLFLHCLTHLQLQAASLYLASHPFLYFLCIHIPGVFLALVLYRLSGAGRKMLAHGQLVRFNHVW